MGRLSSGSARQWRMNYRPGWRKTGVDGFNLRYAVTPETFESIVDLLVPELQRRGVYPKAYRRAPCGKAVRKGPYLSESHPANRYRDIEAVKRAQALLPTGS